MTEVLELATSVETEAANLFGGTIHISTAPNGTYHVDRLNLEPGRIVTTEVQSLAGDAALAGF